jgi:acyl-CoA reductase-like NAD-dependent aldehyde dehydrogenase
MADIPDYQTTEEGRAYEAEIMTFLSGDKRDYPSYFGGLMIASGNEFIVDSPIDSSISFGRFQEPEEGIMEEAVTAAVKAQGPWARTPVAERAAYFEKLIPLLKQQRMQLAASVTVSAGMVREDALAEVDTLISAVKSLVEESKNLKKRPVGVWAVLSAHNSPLASPCAYAVAAMIAGNTVVMNPSKYCPIPVYMFYGLMESLRIPDGVLNLVVDRKDSSTEALANDMRVTGIVATGSGDRLEDLMFLQVDDELSFINELKGMNPALVYRPSDMKAAVRAIIDSAFSFAGQGLYACSKVIITGDDQKKFLEVLSEQMKDIEVGDPVNDTTDCGPVISRDAVKRYGKLRDEVLPFIVAKTQVAGVPDGCYAGPIAVSGLDPEHDLNYMDSGLPIINIAVVESLDRAFEELEDTECGLSAGLFSKDPKVIDRFKKEADAPFKYINESSRTLRAAAFCTLDRFVR